MPTYIKCPHCQEEARVIVEDGRYFVRCVCCGYHNYLKLTSLSYAQANPNQQLASANRTTERHR